ncbi:hypothetical protein A7U43_08735 [Mycobacterium adipatum]|uniref:YCII-related domain-containing protein n=1 Tax=Mycobacterium adipatum TaxID=1682113 RepID=A0A172UK70_9MYCO|nr:YciI family protein [Mycobacterium adipatum]ANE79398.1 hypothetical protein A7U43_08735 [Mycobacterium adipatum]MBI5734748.1 hypothetical protein [Mycolicibacterium neoaurum]
MFVVLLRFADNKSAAADHMAAHRDWVQQGVDDGVLVLVGGIHPGVGGALIATGISREEIAQRVADDPFVVHEVVGAEIAEIEPNITDPRLTFLAG